jgi:ribose transport system substrate-binding protein
MTTQKHRRPAQPCRTAARTPRARLRATTLLVITATAVVSLAACSTSSQDAKTSSDVSSQTLSAVRGITAQAEAQPAFTAPGPQVDAAKAKGKSLFIIPETSEIEACSTTDTDLVSIAKQEGIKTTVFQDTGLTSQWVQGIGLAIQEHYSAVGLVCGIDPTAIAPEVEKARAAGIAVIGFNQNDKSVKPSSLTTAVTSSEEGEAMRLAVDDALANADGTPVHAVMVVSDESLQTPVMVSSAQSELKERCPTACSLTLLNVPIPDWSTQLQQSLSSALLRSPGTNAVILQLDGMTEYAVPALESTHNSKLKIYTFGGSTSVIKDMTESNSVIAEDTGAGSLWSAYVDLDQVIRAVTGGQPASSAAAYTPVRMFTPANASEYFDGATQGFGNGFVTGFQQLWKQ